MDGSGPGHAAPALGGPARLEGHAAQHPPAAMRQQQDAAAVAVIGVGGVPMPGEGRRHVSVPDGVGHLRRGFIGHLSRRHNRAFGHVQHPGAIGDRNRRGFRLGGEKVQICTLIRLPVAALALVRQLRRKARPFAFRQVPPGEAVKA